MPISRRAALDALRLDGVLSLDLDSGVAAIDLARESFVDAYAVVGLACFIASAAGDGWRSGSCSRRPPTSGAGCPGCTGLPGVVEGVRGLDGVVWIQTGAVSRTITRGRETTIGVSRPQGTIVGARLPCRPGR